MSGRAVRAVEGGAIAVAALAWLALATRWLHAAAFGAELLLLPAALGAGVIASDLLSGLVHFACDRFGSAHTPIVGRAFIAPFREHHRDPQAIARHGFRERNGNNALALLPCMAIAHAALPEGSIRASGTLAYAALLAMFGALAWTNEVHAFAHGSRAPRVVRTLQRAGLLLSRAAHHRHHDGDHDRAYCITTGWCNAVLDRTRFWSTLERALSRRA